MIRSLTMVCFGLSLATGACEWGGGPGPSAYLSIDDAPSGSPDASSPSPDGSTIAPDARPDGSVSGCSSPFSGVLASWSFAAEPGSEASVPASTNATGVVASAVTRAAALTPASGAGSINSSNWATAAQRDSTKYYAASVTPPAGCSLSLTSASIDAKSSGSGPASAEIATSADNYVQTHAVSTSAASAPTLSVVDATTPVEIRVYGYAASSPAGTMRLENTLSITGTIQ